MESEQYFGLIFGENVDQMLVFHLTLLTHFQKEQTFILLQYKGYNNLISILIAVANIVTLVDYLGIHRGTRKLNELNNYEMHSVRVRSMPLCKRGEMYT